MGVLLDHLSSILVAGATILLLLAVQVRSGEEAIDRTLVETGWRSAQGFTMVLEDDFLNVGFGVHPSDAAITAYSATSITFRRKVMPPDPAARAATDPETLDVVDVTYTVVQSGEIAGADGAHPLYEVRRTQSDLPGSTTSAPLLDYEHELVRRDGTATSDPAEAVAVRVGYSLTRGTRVRDIDATRVRYDRTFYPPSLDR